MFGSTRPERRVAAIVLLLFAVWPVTGCSPEDENRPFATFDRAGEEPQARLDGTLSLDGGCLLLRDENEREVPLVFPRSALWHEAGRVVLDEAEAEVGSWVQLGGGASRGQDWEPEHCYARDEPFLVYRITEVDDAPATDPQH